MDNALEFIRRLAFSKYAALGILFAVFFALERLAPLRRRRQSAKKRFVVNAGLALVSFGLTMGFAFGVQAFFGTGADATTYSLLPRGIGLLEVLGLGGVGLFVFGLLLYDLTYYYWHIALHRVPLLWRFHNVHHVDFDMDVSTALRFHPGELVLGAGFTALQVGFIGLGGWPLAAAYVVFRGGMLFHHSNLRLPFRFERAIGHVLVTPRVHGIHHSVVRKEANSNYAVLFRLWDRLHGTLKLNVPQGAIDIGVPGYKSPQDNAFEPLLIIPFAPQRDYWRLPDGEWPDRDDVPGKSKFELMP